MSNLKTHVNTRAHGLDSRDYSGVTRDVFLFPDTQVFRGNATFRSDCRGFNDNGAHAMQGKFAQVNEVKWGRESIPR